MLIKLRELKNKYNKLSKLSKYDLEKMLNELSDKMNTTQDKKSEKYRLLDTKYRIIDIILNPTKAEMKLNSEIDDFFKFDNSKELKDAKVLNYKHMGKINFPIAQ